MNIDKLKVAELKAELTSRGLDVKGTKAVLAARLREAMDAAGESSGASPEPQVVGAAAVEAVETNDETTEAAEANEDQEMVRQGGPLILFSVQALLKQIFEIIHQFLNSYDH